MPAVAYRECLSFVELSHIQTSTSHPSLYLCLQVCVCVCVHKCVRVCVPLRARARVCVCVKE